MTVGGSGITVNMAARPGVMEAASIDSGLGRNDGWGSRYDGEYGSTAYGNGGGKHRFRLAPE